MIWQHLTLPAHSLLLEYVKRGMIRTKKQMVAELWQSWTLLNVSFPAHVLSI